LALPTGFPQVDRSPTSSSGTASRARGRSVSFTSPPRESATGWETAEETTARCDPRSHPQPGRPVEPRTNYASARPIATSAAPPSRRPA